MAKNIMSKLIPKYLEGNKLLDESSKYAVLYTYYPFVSSYPLTGHSSLTITGSKDDRYRPFTVDKGGEHKDYNLVTNNCSDATRCALEKAFNKKINPFLFTTPGDVQDFALEELNGIPKIKGDSIYSPFEHKYKLDLRPELTKRLHKGMNTVYIPINKDLRDFLKLYIEQGNKNKEFKKGGKLIPKHLKGKSVKYFGAYNPKLLAYVLPVYKKEGVVLPEITITPKNNTNLGGYMQNRDFGLGKEIASYTPAGDVIDATQIYKDTKQGNYGQAALSTGLFFLPNVIEKPLKKVGKWFGKNFFPKNTNDELEKVIKAIQYERKLKADRDFELKLLDSKLGEISNKEYVLEIYGDRWKNAFNLALKRGYLLGYTLDDVRDALTLESRGYFGGVPFKHQSDAEMIKVNGNWGSNTPFAYATNKNGRETVYINSDKMYKNGITDDELDTGLHEVAHANTLRVEPGTTNEMAEAILSSVLKEQDPIRYKREKIIKDVMKYNKDISDVVDEGMVINPRTGDLYINDLDNKDMDKYLRETQEMRSRALSINSNAKRNNISSDEIIDNANIDGNSAEMQAAQLKAASKNPKKFTKEVLGVVPLVGYYGLSREDDRKYKNGGLIRKKRFIKND